MARLVRNLGNLALLIGLALPFDANAGPVVAPGDVGLRHDIQVLADYGVIRGPVTTWPLAWDAIRADLSRARDEQMVLPVAVERTLERLLARAERESLRGRHRVKGRLAAAEKPIVIRGFADTPREEGELGAGYDYFSDLVTLDLNVSGVDNPADGDAVRADGSLLAVELGNVSLGLSTMDRWWGPGWDGSQILSNNARPIPAITLERNRTDAFETKWLSWLGPWDFSFIWGQMEKERDVPNARFLGFRFAFKPHPSLEIGLSRTAQWCGDGRPCDFDTFWDLLLGRDNRPDPTIVDTDEPGNQLAAFDFRWTNRWFGAPLSFYGQATAEDEAGGFPSRYMAMGGLEFSGYIRNRWSYRWYGEFAVNNCDALNSNGGFNCAYIHDVYTTGYQYKGRIVGHGADSDARIGSLGIILTDNDATQWQLLLRFGDLNDGTPPDNHNTLTRTPKEIASVDVRFGLSTGFGRFDIGAGYEQLDDKPTGISTDETRAYLSWSSP